MVMMVSPVVMVVSSSGDDGDSGGDVRCNFFRFLFYLFNSIKLFEKKRRENKFNFKVK